MPSSQTLQNVVRNMKGKAPKPIRPTGGQSII